MIGALHDRWIRPRRVRVLAAAIAEWLPAGPSVLDVGCGDGAVAKQLAALRPDLQIQGLDVLIRRETQIPVRSFDGRQIPEGDGSFDVVLLVDVLHHAHDPAALLREAKRVARRAIIVKDHCRDGLLAGPTLRLMDWVGNARHGVALPYEYWPRARWLATFHELQLEVDQWRSKLRLYAGPAGWIFDRSLHFLARLTTRNAVATPLFEK